MPIPVAALTLTALNHLLGQAEWARARLRPFAGRHARIVSPLLSLRLVVADDGRFAEATDEAVADVVIELPAPTPADLLAGRESLFARAHINGKADFADALGFVLRNLNWDVEEDLSRMVGDIAAHRISGALNAFVAWNRQAMEKVSDNLAEYLAEESRVLTPGRELQDFARGISELNDRLARLESSLRRLNGNR